MDLRGSRAGAPFAKPVPDQDPAPTLSDITALQDTTQVLGNWHRLQGAHVRKARISGGHPDARKDTCGNDSRQLTRDLAPVTYRSPKLEHEPVNMDMLHRVALAQNVRSREMVKCLIGVASGGGNRGGVQFSGVRRSKRACHSVLPNESGRPPLPFRPPCPPVRSGVLLDGILPDPGQCLCFIGEHLGPITAVDCNVLHESEHLFIFRAEKRDAKCRVDSQ